MTVAAGSLAGSGEGLRMLQKIQGKWQSGCMPHEDVSRYQRQFFRFSFTHLRQRDVHFADAICSIEVGQKQVEYRYTLGEALDLSAGKRAFALNLEVVDGSAVEAQLHRYNIAHYSDGALLFGLDGNEAPKQRLVTLDTGNPLRRP